MQETKLEVIDRELAIEISGGILLAVDEAHYKIKAAEIGVHTVSELLEWSITAVYGPQEDNEKLQFLGELRLVQHNVNAKWG